MNVVWTFVLFPLLALVLTGCMGSSQNTIGDLRSIKEDDVELNLDKLDHKAVRTEYQEILALIEDKDLKQQIERRIADVYLLEGQKSLATPGAKPNKSYYAEAIISYREVLDKYPDSPDNAEILYQLAKAYDIEGRQQEALRMLNRLTATHPNFAYNGEVYFRKGDIYFNDKKYHKAELAYRAVTRMKVQKLTINAHYMLGWSLYKQAIYKEGLESFAVVLDDALGGGANIESLDKATKSIVKDALHSMSLALVHDGGAAYINKIGKLSRRAYVWRLYEALGEHFLEKERFEDSANTYRSYVTNYTNSEKAPDLHRKLIQVYFKGGFPKQALPEKERFIQYYGLHSGYKGIVGDVKAGLKPALRKYLEELARHYHADAQQHEKMIKGIDPKKNPGRIKKAGQERIASYEKAAKFYKEFIDTFPNDKKRVEMLFLKAETYYASNQFELAITDYEKVAYEFPSSGKKKYQAKAGYAAIIAYQKIVEKLGSTSRKSRQWQEKAVASMLRFAQTFYQDKRSPAVLTNAAEYLFGLDKYPQALQVASDLLQKNTTLDKSLKQTAYGIQAHSLFKMLRYAEAELAYVNQRNLVAKSNKEYAKISERIAITIYKKSEVLVVKNNQTVAIAQLLKIKTMAPDSAVRVTAQFDAATMLLAMEQWTAAIVELKELLALFPTYKLAAEFPRKLAFALEKNGQWGAAAKRYQSLSINDADAEIRREALFIAATLYEKSRDFDTAITLFKKYANAYEQPFDTRMEARYHLATTYEKIKDMTRHLYWLRRVIAGDKKAGKQRTARSIWLGAWANSKYGDYFSWEFKRRKLRLPLEKSLPKKNLSLQSAIGFYQKSADYGILEFVTSSSYSIGSLYERFARDLRSVARPSGLSRDDAKAYTQILDEQAAPFVELAVQLHQANIDRAWQGQTNEWIAKSFDSMRNLQPERYKKVELEVSYGDEIL